VIVHIDTDADNEGNRDIRIDSAPGRPGRLQEAGRQPELQPEFG
jgi:hypothetical protein